MSPIVTDKDSRPRPIVLRRVDLLLSPAVLVALVAIWQAVTVHFEIPTFILPPPLDVWRALVAGFSTGPLSRAGFLYHSGVTFGEAILGFVFGSLFGIALGFLVASSRVVERVAMPYIVAFQSMPKVALAPLLVIWFGFGIDSKIVITSVITFFPLLVNSIAGYHSVDPDRIDLARSCNASRLQILWKIIIPSSLPYIFAGLNVASVLALLGAIIGEFVGAQSGLGMLLLQYNQTMQTGSVFAVLLILALGGFVMNSAIRALEHRFCFWAKRAPSTPEG
jgi:NitT/TauT family transport system permease protein